MRLAYLDGDFTLIKALSNIKLGFVFFQYVCLIFVKFCFVKVSQ